MNDYNYNLGTEFERQLLFYLMDRFPGDEWGKPDIYNFTKGILIEAKCTRPYYDKSPAHHSDAEDIGTGLPGRQFEKYKMAVSNGQKVYLAHKMTEGKYQDKIFFTELNKHLIDRVQFSPNGNTVYWLYNDLELKKLDI